MLKHGWFESLLNPWCDEGLLKRLWIAPPAKPKWNPARRAEEAACPPKP